MLMLLATNTDLGGAQERRELDGLLSGVAAGDREAFARLYRRTRTAVYGLAPEGNVANIYIATVLFSLVMSGLGVFIANRSATLLQSIFMTFAFIVIFQLMGGLFTPIASMPRWAQCITYAIPPRYFIEIMRSVYLKGAGIGDLWTQYAALSGFAALLCAVAAATYRKRA